MTITSKRLSLSFLWSFLEQGSTSIVSLIVQIILARLLLPDDFGVMAILLVIISLANAISQSGLGTALIQKRDATKTTFSTAFWLSLLFSIILYAVIFLGAPLLAIIYSMPDLTLYLRILGLSVLFDSINSIQRSLLQKELRFKSLFRVNFFSILISAAISIILALNGFGIWSLIVQTICQVVASCLALFLQIPWKPSLEFNMYDAKDMFKYGWKICLTSILNTCYTGLSELIIGKTNTASDLGYYSQGRKWPNAAMGAVNNALQNVLFPALSTMQNDIPTFRSAIRKILSTGFYITAPICLLSAVIAEPLIAILLGESWLPCTLIFQFSCLGYVLIMPQAVNLRAYMALGHSGLYLKLQIIKVISGSVLFSFIALVSQNIYVVAATVLLHNICCVIFVDMHPAKKTLGVGTLEQLKIIIPSFSLSLFSAFIASLIQFVSFGFLIQMVLQILVFSIIYLSGSNLFKVEGYSACIEVIAELIKR